MINKYNKTLVDNIYKSVKLPNECNYEEELQKIMKNDNKLEYCLDGIE